MVFTYSNFKRICDLILSLSCLILLSPLLIILFLLIFSIMGFPIFFTQERLGLSGSSFKLLKFRTMSLDVDEKNCLLPDHLRVTRLGSFLRSTSLDELPSLLNILCGSMSFVGPRPLPVKYLSRYSKYQANRMLVVPGLTGLAQVKGRNNTTWSKRFTYDLKYVHNQSFCLDVSILIKTVFVVFSRTGINNSSLSTMPEFTGDDSQ